MKAYASARTYTCMHTNLLYEERLDLPSPRVTQYLPSPSNLLMTRILSSLVCSPPPTHPTWLPKDSGTRHAHPL